MGIEIVPAYYYSTSTFAQGIQNWPDSKLTWILRSLWMSKFASFFQLEAKKLSVTS